MEQREAMRISIITMVGNIVLSAIKLAAGIIARSGAMISDAMHSASDVFSTIVVMIGIHAAGKEADEEHPYGHERMESIAAILLSAVLLATGLGIGWDGLQKILAAVQGNAETLTVPGWLALAAAVISIAAKEGMYQATKIVARRIRSDALMADAWHHRSDALSSIGSFVGIGGAMLGFPVMDSIASVVICLFIVKAAYDIAAEAIRKMVDHSADRETEEAARRLILSHEGVIALRMLKTRQFGSKVYMDVVMTADAALSFQRAHALAEEVHDAIEKSLPTVKHVMVHIEPDEHAGSRPIFVLLCKHWHAAERTSRAPELLAAGDTLTIRFPLCGMLYDGSADYDGVLEFSGCRRYELHAPCDPIRYWEYGVQLGRFYRIENDAAGAAFSEDAVTLSGSEADAQHYLLSLPTGDFECEATGFSFAVEQVGASR